MLNKHLNKLTQIYFIDCKMNYSFYNLTVIKMKVTKGNIVKIDYTGKLEDGTVFDSSKSHDKPLEFEVGSGHIIEGFDKAMIGMMKEDEKEITLKPAEAYGEINPDLLKKIPKEQFPKDAEITVGMMLEMNSPDGMKIPVIVSEIGDKEITIDLNHPMAGKTLIFNIKLLSVRKQTKKEIEDAKKKGTDCSSGCSSCSGC